MNKNVAIESIHVLPNRMRKLRPELVEVLQESIRTRGLLQPIVVREYLDQYALVAGLHRLMAVENLGYKKIRAEICEGMGATAAELAEIDENLMRGELSAAERALHLGRRKELYEAAHPDTVSVRVRGGPGRGRKNEGQNDPRFTADAAVKTGKSESTIKRSVARAEALGEDTLQKITGTVLDAPEQLDALAKMGAEQRAEVVERALVGEKVSAKVEIKKQKREEREVALATRITALPTVKFGVIVEDLEWDFEVWSRNTGMDRHAANHYPVAEVAHSAIELYERTKDRFGCAADDCVLFMWTTVPLLKTAVELMGLRGFRYVSNYVWIKDKAGTGYWNRNKHEHLLIGARGNTVAPAPGTQWESVIVAPVGKHSEKPDCVLQMIEQYYPNVPKIELNCRGVPRAGWQGWGNELVHELRGYARMAVNKGSVEPAVLNVIQRDDRWFAVSGSGWEFQESETAIAAQVSYNCTDLVGETRVLINGESEDFEFYPEDGECERIGMPIGEAL